MKRVYRFEVVEERYRALGNALLRARDSADGSMVTLCEWTPQSQLGVVNPEKLAEAAGILGGTEFFSTGSSFYLAAGDDASATAALEKLRSQGWFSGQWPGLISAPAEPRPAAKRPAETVGRPEAKIVVQAAPTPRRNWLGIVLTVGVAFVVGIVVLARLSQKQGNPRPPATEFKAAAAASTESAPKPEQLPVSQPQKQEPTVPPEPLNPSPPLVASREVPELIMAVLEHWRAAMLASDADGLADCYAPVVELFFRRKNLDRDTLRRMERAGMNAWPHVDHYQLSAFVFEPIREDRAAVVFHKYWDSWDALREKHFAGEEKEQLTFERIAGEWKIVREEELTVDWVKRQ